MHANRQVAPPFRLQHILQVRQKVAQFGGNGRIGDQQRPAFVVDRTTANLAGQAGWQSGGDRRESIPRLGHAQGKAGKGFVAVERARYRLR